MEKDIDKIPKNPETDIVIRIDDFGGKKGLTIREFVKSERYTGFTKSGTRIPAEYFKQFKEAINSIDENDLKQESSGESQENLGYDPSTEPKDDTSAKPENPKDAPEEQEI